MASATGGGSTLVGGDGSNVTCLGAGTDAVGSADGVMEACVSTLGGEAVSSCACVCVGTGTAGGIDAGVGSEFGALLA